MILTKPEYKMFKLDALAYKYSSISPTKFMYTNFRIFHAHQHLNECFKVIPKSLYGFYILQRLNRVY